jgi:hypothetical protein
MWGTAFRSIAACAVVYDSTTVQQKSTTAAQMHHGSHYSVSYVSTVAVSGNLLGHDEGRGPFIGCSGVPNHSQL